MVNHSSYGEVDRFKMWLRKLRRVKSYSFNREEYYFDFQRTDRFKKAKIFRFSHVEE